VTTDTQTQFAPSPDQALAQLSLALVSDLQLHQFLALCEGINKLNQASERLERRMERWSVNKLNQLDLMVRSRAALKAGLITQKDFEAITGQAAEGVRELRTAISRYGILRDGAETYLRDVPPDATKTKQ